MPRRSSDTSSKKDQGSAHVASALGLLPVPLLSSCACMRVNVGVCTQVCKFVRLCACMHVCVCVGGGGLIPARICGFMGGSNLNCYYAGGMCMLTGGWQAGFRKISHVGTTYHTYTIYTIHHIYHCKFMYNQIQPSQNNFDYYYCVIRIGQCMRVLNDVHACARAQVWRQERCLQQGGSDD